MTDAAHPKPECPVWAREDAFPEAPAGWGWVDIKGKSHPAESTQALRDAIREDRDAGIVLAWTPDQRFMILPEEVENAADAVFASRKRRAIDDFADSLSKLRFYGLLLGAVTLYTLYRGWAIAPGIATASERLGFALRGLISSTPIGIALLMFLILAFIPWYQARKRLRELRHWNPDELARIIPTLRFETWLDAQKAPFTRILLGLVALVGLAQLLGSGESISVAGLIKQMLGADESIKAAGLVKERYFTGEWWRLLTAPFLHGNIVHFLMNAAALAYLGKRVEVFARWPHLILVFLFSACVGGECSARFIPTTSVGASGGLIGWLGFLLVFESLHGSLVPRRARKRLAAGVLLTAVIGLVGYRFIDNAAHLGGLLAGMLYAAIVFPKSATSVRPRSTLTDRFAGAAALAVLTGSALYAAFRILQA